MQHDIWCPVETELVNQRKKVNHIDFPSIPRSNVHERLDTYTHNELFLVWLHIILTKTGNLSKIDDFVVYIYTTKVKYT